MFVVTVTFQILPDQMKHFLPLMIENARHSLRDEPGCKQFDVCRGDDDVIFLYEVYDTQAAFALHLDSAHFKVFDKAVAAMVVRKDVQTYDKVPL